MKKIFLTIVIAVGLCTTLQAQNTRISTDTLPCGVRLPSYWYGAWFDTVDWYLYGSGRDSIHIYNDGRDTYYYHWTPNQIGFYSFSFYNEPNYQVAYKQYASHPIRVKGIWGMLSQYAGRHPNELDGGNYYYPVLDSARLREDFYLYQRIPNAMNKTGCTDLHGKDSVGGDTTQYKPDCFELLCIDSVRWDTAHPKMMCLQSTLDTVFAGQNHYCHVYEALFDTVYTVEGEFWLGGSQHSTMRHDLTDPAPHGWLHFPTHYVSVGEFWDRWHDTNALVASRTHGNEPYCLITRSWSLFGPFGIITDDQRYMEVSSADASQGLGLYTAFYPDSTYQTITAVPKRGFVFSHWNDGDTTNPRTVYVVSDTAFTAYFDSLPLYSVEVQSSDSGHCEVTGGGTYYEGETANIGARPGSGYRFVCWNDSVRDNPRTIMVTQDTVFTAIFEAIPSYTVEVFSNNEAYGRVTGSGTYYENTGARIEALPNAGHYFRRWNDGSRETPRTIVVTQDTSFTAIFGVDSSAFEGIESPEAAALFALTPNPARESVTVTLDGADLPAEITVYDAAGHAVQSRRATTRRTRLSTRSLPAGQYFVTVATPQATATRKLVIK